MVKKEGKNGREGRKEEKKGKEKKRTRKKRKEEKGEEGKGQMKLLLEHFFFFFGDMDILPVDFHSPITARTVSDSYF